MIEVDHLTKYFGPVLAVDDISFKVSRGEIVGFLGLNGAGKTTTMRILTTFLPATSGVAKVAGHDVMNESMEVRQNIGYLPESVPLYPEMRVEEYLDYRAKLKGVDRSVRQQRIEEAMERCRIREVRRRLLGTLSKGYRQRVGLADSLSHDPPMLIMDEPTSGLDPVQIRETLHTIKDLAEQHTILLSTHILSEVEAICSRVIIIHRGAIGVDRKMADLMREDDAGVLAEIRGPRDAVTSALKSIDGVKSVESKLLEKDLCSYEVRAVGKKDLREAVFNRVVQGKWVMRRLEPSRRKLEEYFMDLTMRSDGPA
ncbi:MAG TPA: ATP-binding cassette domain-containing protein [Gemmataceae bacterium]|nr:ATP-binding cassette domain-containing protein [Gemmataceae bacterium]